MKHPSTNSARHRRTAASGKHWPGIAGLAALTLAANAPAADSPAKPPAAPSITDFADLGLDQLANMSVTSVGKKEQKLTAAPAAIYVLTEEDVRRSGATSIPEALRLVPGLEVARVDAHNWAISARGFNDIYANKLLVLMDGRSVYTPLFAGVYWDVQDMFLPDLDRIEVIRGPGGTLWGANAVNGVININSKTASQTQGTLVTGGGGTEDRALGGLRHGGKLGEDTYYRAYVKYGLHDDSELTSGRRANDAWSMVRTGFRIDHEPKGPDLFTVQGDLYAGWQDQTFVLPSLTPPYTSTLTPAGDLSGGNLLGRWTHTFSEESNLRIQTYYDRTSRDVGFFAEDRDTVDVDAQHRFRLAGFNDIVWGVGYRVTSSHIKKESFALSFDQNQRTDHLFNTFVQDEIRLVPDRLALTLGSKFEHNDYTGFEVQPNARLMWTPHERHSVWASVARAVRTPSQAHYDLRLNTAVIPGAPATVVGIFGDEDVFSEDLIAYELGYRVRPMDRLSLDFTAFYNDYRNLSSTVRGTPYFEATPAPPHAVVPLTFANTLQGEVYGVEGAATARLTDGWQVRAGYTFTQMQLHQQGGTGADESPEGASPHHRFFLHSMLNLPHDVQFDGVLRYVDSLPALQIPSYVEMDLRLSWKPWKNTEFSLVGQNLLQSRHSEYTSQSLATPRTDVQRSVYAQVMFRF